MTFTEVMDGVVRGFEIAGVMVLAGGGLIALAAYVRDLFRVARCGRHTSACGKNRAAASCWVSRSSSSPTSFSR